MFLVKYVVMQDIFNYYPRIKFADTYEAAQEIQYDIDERFKKEEDEPDELEPGKIVSEPSIEEIKFDEKPNKKKLQVDELLTCKRCNEPAKRVVANTLIGVELLWNDKESIYEVAEESYSLEDSKSVLCAGCLTDLLKQE
ncbi:MAG: hypothetical protein ABSG15_00785 [FCB group bacterium]|jgi:hypothetical protein